MSIIALMGAAINTLFFGPQLFYAGIAGLDATTAGPMMIPYGLGTLIAMPITGRLSDRIDGRLLVWAGTVNSSRSVPHPLHHPQQDTASGRLDESAISAH